MADNIEFKVTGSKGTPIIIQEAGPLEVNVQSAPKENVKMSKEELKLQILSSVAGAKGDSMYDIAVKYGYEGTEEEFINEFMQGGSGNGFYNVDNEHPITGANYTLESAVAVVSSDTSITNETKNGMIITFWDGTEWKTYRYKLVYDSEQPEEFADVDNWEEFKGSGGGGDETGRIILRRESDNITTKVGSPVHIRFFYDHVTGTGDEQQSTGNAGIARIIISRAGYQQTLNRTLSAGSHYDIDLTRYMGIGITTVRLQVQVDTGLVVQSAALAWTMTEVALHLTSDSLLGYTAVEQGNDLEVAWTLESGSSDTKTVLLYLDGNTTTAYAQQTVGSSVANGTFTINTALLSHGGHTVQLRAQQSTGEYDENEHEILIYSNLLYAVVGVYDGITATPILTLKVDIEDGSTLFGAMDTLTLNLNQYSTLELGYGARTEGNITTSVVIKEDTTSLLTIDNNREPATFTTRVLTSGTHHYSINSADQLAQIAFDVVATAVDLGVEVPSGRVMYLDSIEHGHTNSDVNRDQWSNTEPPVGGTEVTTTMTGFNWSSNGWFNNALRLNGTAQAVINFNPLRTTTSGGTVCGFKYKCTDLSEGHENDVVISCLDTNDTGFYITPQEIGIKQNGDIRTTMKTSEGDVYDVAFVVWPAGGSSSDARKNARFIYIYINGEMSGCYRLAQGSSVFQNNSVPITIAPNSYCNIDIFRTWAYNRALNDSEMLDTYILDLDDDIDVLLEARDRNDILDSTGNVTPESLPDGTRVMIITGTAVEPSSGVTMASVLAAAQYNDKSTYFPVQEISTYIKGSDDRSKNFIARNNGTGQETGKNIPLRIRLQGTSSLAYPVKNYRIYTNKSEMYVGNNPDMPFGETGTLVVGGKFAMHDDSAPVAVWCLKADYAESSSTHNTGMARMVNDTLKACNIPTPAQRDVDTTEYPYEVRTTVDGEPMVLFYRETLTDTPLFLGKFNFNNDKSTEAVYGFTGIKGYHNVSPLNNIDNTDTEFVAQQYKESTGEDLGVDLTECWEFKNNEDPMGSFLDDDFNSTVVDPDSGVESPKWLGTFEARYPDEDDLNDKFADVEDPIVPHYLSTLVSWVKSTGVLSTDTDEQAAAKKLKFKNELSAFFDVEHLCTYFVFTQMMACLDQMVKNMMMGFWYDKDVSVSVDSEGVATGMGKTRAYMIFYDNDTINGLINNGRLLAPWDVQRDTVQLYDAQQNPVYFYAGHESVLWNNLVTEFPTEIRNAYVKVRTYLTNQKIFEYFDRDQAEKFCERIYNLDGLNKYVAPTGMDETAVAPYRDLMQGSRTSHRHWFIKNRLSLFDNSWRAGEYYSSANEISFKGISAGGSTITLTIRKDGNVEVQSDVSDDFVKNYVVAGNTPTTIGKLTPSAVGTIFHVYGMRQLTKLDLSAWDFDQLNLGNFQYLEEFVFGSKVAFLPTGDWRNSGGYIQSSGTQYIDTNYKFQIGDEIECTYSIMGYPQNTNAIFGGSTSSSVNSVVAEYFPSSGNIKLALGSVVAWVAAVTYNTKYKLELKNTGVYVNNSKVNNNVINQATNYNIYLFALNNAGNTIEKSTIKLFNFIVKRGANKIVELYPAIDGNGVACMYDYVTEQFFYNQGTGGFTVSDEVRNAETIIVEKDNPFTKPYYNLGLLLGNSMPKLKKFVAQNLAALPSADLSGCPLIEEIDLSGSFKMGSVNIPVGAPLTKYKLPTAGGISAQRNWRITNGFIESNGTQSIDTGIIPSAGVVVKMKARNPNFGVVHQGTAGGMWFGSTYQSNTFEHFLVNNSSKYTDSSTSAVKEYEYSFSNYLKIDGTTVKTVSQASPSSNHSMFLFQAYDINSQAPESRSVITRIYSFIVEYNGALICEMYPAIDGDGVACMYDYVSEQFFYNQGTGDFSVSSEVENAPFVISGGISPFSLSLVGLPKLKFTDNSFGVYISSTKYAGIDSGFQLSSNSYIKTEFYNDGDNIQKWIYGYERDQNGTGWNGVYINNNTLYIYNNAWSQTPVIIQSGISIGWHTLEIQSGSAIKFDGGSTSVTAPSPSGQLANFGILNSIGVEQTGANPTIRGHGGIKLRYFKYGTSNSNLLRDLIPAVDSNGVACMYDDISEEYLYNAGTSLDDYLIYDEGDTLELGYPSKINSLTFSNCPNIDGFALLKRIATATDTSLGSVNVTLPSAISGPIADLIAIANLWNSNTGEASNLKVYGSYTVTDASLTAAQCAAIGYDVNNSSATQMSSKIYGLMITIDQSIILPDPSNMALQTFDSTVAATYNPAMSIILEQYGYGTYVNVNDKTSGWFLTKQQALSFTKFYDVVTPSRGAVSHLFYRKSTVTDTNGICGIVGENYDFVSMLQIESFKNVTEFIEGDFRYLTELTTVVIPSNLKYVDKDTFSNDAKIKTVYYNATSCELTGSGDYGVFNGSGSSLENLIIKSSVQSIVEGLIYRNSVLKGEIVIPNAVTELRWSTFREITSACSFIIGSGVTQFNNATFYGSSGITYMHLLSEIPPTLITMPLNRTTCVFYVGDGSSAAHDDAIVNIYKSAAGWSEFSDRIQSWYNHINS